MMIPDFDRCIRSMDEVRRRLATLEAHLFAHDMEGASRVVQDAWRSHLEPIEYLSSRYDGEFWRAWDRRSLILGNLARAKSALLGAGPGDVEWVLRRLAQLIEENVGQLQDALSLLHADIAPDADVRPA